MKKRNYIALLLILMSALILETCGPVVLSSRSESPPPWFYPNRVEMVRYVYFPEYSIYYDLTLSNYLYLNNGVWIRVKVLPPRYNNINLNRSKYVRVKGYRGDNIRTYHKENNVRSNTRTSRRTNTTRTRRN